ncbi:hypothetical protein [Epibacterium ulvae]|uniref:hypothetical protein n=1 Tax=Epibacterium ulvae TaxID=1156985 RepID=UPI002490BC8E|nr:hypothetical protein [Epibacterium ulvae]
MKSSISVQIDDIAEQLAEDETGELFASIWARILREFRGDPEEFGKWLQSAMNNAQDFLNEYDGEEWPSHLVARIETAALQLF